MLKKILINIAIVLLTVVALDFAVGQTLRFFYFNESSGLHYRTTYSMNSTTADILIFGASKANHHYVPEVFEDSLEMSYYNTGRDGNGIFYQLAVLKSILKRHSPKIVVLDFVGTFEKEAKYYDRLSSLLPYYQDHEEIREIVKLKSPFEEIKLWSQTYPFNSLITTIAIGNTEYNKTRKLDNKGYVPLYGEWEESIEYLGLQPTKAIDSKQKEALIEFIQLAKKSGSKVYVIFSPVYAKFERKGDKNFEICKEVTSMENVPFWDLSKDSIFLDNKLFQDPDHLNHNGALEFSKLAVINISNDLNK